MIYFDLDPVCLPGTVLGALLLPACLIFMNTLEVTIVLVLEIRKMMIREVRQLLNITQLRSGRARIHNWVFYPKSHFFLY